MTANSTLTAIEGVLVGHHSDLASATGCTVIVLPEPNIVAGEVRGAAPATRELGLLGPGMTVTQAQAVLLTGGSAFGLAAADGVVADLEAQGRGHETKHGRIPIVPTAALYDLGVGDAAVRPTAADGRAALQVASSEPVAQGLVGAGVGATCGKWRGERIPAGLGSAVAEVAGVQVGVIVAVNALGDAFSLEGQSLTGGPHIPGPAAEPSAEGENTTLALVVTDAALDRNSLGRMIVRAHDAFGACLRPAHTAFDGDICFAASVGSLEAKVPDVCEAAFEAVGRAIEYALLAARS